MKPTAKSGVESVQEGKRASILVVDDDPMLLKMTALILNDRSYKVTLAATGREAIDAAHLAGGAFDLVILDMRLPDMDGSDVLKELRAVWPTLRVLSTTGYAPESTVRSLLDAGVVSVLEKPYDPDQLGEAVRRALGNCSNP